MKKSTTTDASLVAQTAFIKRLRNKLAIDESLRWNQRDVIHTTIDFLNARHGQSVTEHDSKNGDEAKPITIKKGTTNAALIESSPGSGKTRMMGFIAKQAAHLNGADPKHKSTDAVKVLILTPRLDLNRQTLHEFDEELGIRDKDSALYDGNQTTAERNRAKSAPVLIATYQSLPAMLQDGTLSLDPKSPQYRGLIEMDEVHELVNFKCKPKGSMQFATIDSFVNNHQTTLLFTGTDDGVSQRHFNGKVPTIYSKRLVKAHNQGLTCDPIYPGLVDVSVKEMAFGTEKKKERSKELVDYFGSHPKVIEAAVDAQLTAEHPSMGPLARYKSLFFVNGVDAGRNGKDYFNKKAKELKLINPQTGSYLKAAHIHAKTPKAERKEIIKTYKKGEIAAIFNDSILTFGFDDREAAVVHNLKMHDRDTGARALAQMEQIFTRGTRICDGFKKKPALDGKPYGIDKQALLLTYRPIDTHGQPLNVLTSADLLAGLTLPVIASKEWQFRGENDDDIEKKRKSLSDDFEVHVHFDFDDQVAISEAMRRKIADSKFPYASSEHLTFSKGIPQALGVDRHHKQYMAWRQKTQQQIEAGKIVFVGKYKIEKLMSASGPNWYLHQDAIPKLAEQLGIQLDLPDKTTDDLTLKNELPRALGTDSQNVHYLEWRRKVEKLFSEGNTVELGGHVVKQVRSGVHRPLCLNIGAVEAVKKEVFPEKQNKIAKIKSIPTPKHLNLSSEVPAALGIDRNHTAYKCWREDTENKIKKGRTVKIDNFVVEGFLSPAGLRPYLHSDAVPALANQLGIIINLPDKPDDYVALGEIPRLLGKTKASAHFNAWRTSVEELYRDGETVKLGGFKIEEMKSGVHRPLCIKKQALPILRQVLSELESDMSSVREKRSIAPDSEHIRNRSGRSRT